MPLVIRLDGEGLEVESSTFVVKSKADYAKIGFAAARWARQAVRDARVGEGEDRTNLMMTASFFESAELPENLPGADLPGEEEPEHGAPKRRRKRGKK